MILEVTQKQVLTREIEATRASPARLRSQKGHLWLAAAVGSLAAQHWTQLLKRLTLKQSRSRSQLRHPAAKAPLSARPVKTRSLWLEMRSHCRLKGSLLQGSEPRDQLFQMLKVTRLPSLQSLLMKAPRRSHRQMSSRHPSHVAASCRKLKESLLVPSRPLLRARRTPRKRNSGGAS